ncbi:sigma-70 family RNA polymerase sigma factor [Aequorivita sp. SDUM287046]|uniref:Sigma-70 family RNA polymerase sigma factor n=1 Tax=Aequorivita aurantiaca TaxID=3053356 RepID=A0ABT8DL44_9FLAO|nr:sigma-70 family RNA polymerase sigma factor [Aequorivita aurantiaca]MDN3723772.1 sigma-70 family RNA polymerase sigma factor [Aequorivita aurantiaca]
MVEEKVLVTALQTEADKEAAFRELVSQYKERLYWQIRNMVLDHDDADDVLQNTFIKIFRNINSFKGESKLHTWMYRIAANESITFLNNKAKRNNTSIEAVKDNALRNLESDVYFEGDAIQLQFQKAIALLPERQRLIFTMKYFEDHTFEQLSQILDTSVGGLKSSYHIAVKKITQFIKTNNETL